MKLSSKYTVIAGYIGYTSQALAINFAPLLFVTFEKSYGISITDISILIAISFISQLSIDALAAKFFSHLNTRAFVIFGNLCVSLGLCSFAFLPSIISPFWGLAIATVLCGIGGGFIEVLISPIIEACPTKNKAGAMSLLHSFYCWGTALTILGSTLFFILVGIDQWKILSCLWAVIPLCGALLFCVTPIYTLEADDIAKIDATQGRRLWRSAIFWALILIMFCGGAAEMVMLQWASSFAEIGLGISKATGDLLGPFAFAIFMGTTRLAYAFLSKKISLASFISVSSLLCAIAYFVTALSPYPMLSLLGCSLCGISVALMWPGTYSLATQNISFGGTRMFALLALAGDLGCVVGPSVAGLVADTFRGELRISFAVSAIFPIIILAIIPYILKRNKS